MTRFLFISITSLALLARGCPIGYQNPPTILSFEERAEQKQRFQKYMQQFLFKQLDETKAFGTLSRYYISEFQAFSIAQTVIRWLDPVCVKTDFILSSAMGVKIVPDLSSTMRYPSYTAVGIWVDAAGENMVDVMIRSTELNGAQQEYMYHLYFQEAVEMVSRGKTLPETKPNLPMYTNSALWNQQLK
jgi:hypothetical protein